jgi:threonine dehydratase
MPVATPTIKVNAVRSFGGDAVLFGDNYDDAYAHALQIVQRRNAILVHPFDDPDVIAGQGTIGLEIVRQHPDPIAAVFVPVGGGGLISGIALLIKSLYPQTRIIGVEPVDAAAMHASLAAGELITLPTVGAFADGVAVRRVGEETFRICQRLVDEIVTVSNDEICAAIRDVFEDTRTLVEPAGALGVAGMKRWLADQDVDALRGPLVCISSGANVNFSMLRHVAERTDLGAGREAILAVEIPERPGAFKTFCEAIGRRHITEFNYRYSDSQTARIFVGIELSGGRSERGELIATLHALGYPTLDMSDNEMAKQHIRHMVGGHGRGVTNERLYRFRFPERRGALLDFLTAIGSNWNISLFHYRNHGSDYGRVLVGIQVPDAELADLESHLDQLGFDYADESDNPAFAMFLAS